MVLRTVVGEWELTSESEIDDLSDIMSSVHGYLGTWYCTPSVLRMYNEKRLDMVGLILVPGTNPVPRRHDLIPQMILYLPLCPQQMAF